MDQYFPIFWPSPIKNAGKSTQKYLEDWGWLDFLVEIGLTKVFDKPGSKLNSLECVRESPCFDVLLFASQQKLKSEARILDDELEHKK